MVAWELMIFHAFYVLCSLKGGPELKVCNTRDCKVATVTFYPHFFHSYNLDFFHHILSLDSMENEHRKKPIELRLLMNF